ncbi:MAG TPA: hypothetical protein VGC56_17640 [Allosphingosinicella sp.]
MDFHVVERRAAERLHARLEGRREPAAPCRRSRRRGGALRRTAVQGLGLRLQLRGAGGLIEQRLTWIGGGGGSGRSHPADRGRHLFGS